MVGMSVMGRVEEMAMVEVRLRFDVEEEGNDVW